MVKMSACHAVRSRFKSGHDRHKNMKNINEIKKSLYREKPIAKLIEKNNIGDLTYKTILNDNIDVIFKIPVNETVDGDGKYIFENEMDAKLLNRWIVI